MNAGDWILIVWLAGVSTDNHPIANGPYASLDDCEAVVQVIAGVDKFECARVSGFTLEPILSDIDSITLDTIN